MKIAAIIAEYNPFHNGHLKQLRKAKRESGADALVVVMSGSFTQRGDIAVADKYTRAQWAVAAGADIVLELPTVYSLSTAPFFAEGALKTLSMLDRFTLSFGTETEEMRELGMAAEFLSSESKDVSGLLKSFLAEGYSVAKSRTLALDKIRPDISNMLRSPNNILAVEYMKAGAKYGNKIEYLNVARKPDDGKKIISSTAIREKLAAGEDVSAFVPEFVELDSLTDPNKYNTVATYALRAANTDELAEISGVSEGMENRITKADFANMEQYLSLTTKRYTRSTVKRIAASATVGATKELATLAQTEKPYTTVLAVKNGKKRALLSLLSQADGYFFFKPSDCPKTHPIRPLIELDLKAAKILELCKN